MDPYSGPNIFPDNEVVSMLPPSLPQAPALTVEKAVGTASRAGSKERKPKAFHKLPVGFPKTEGLFLEYFLKCITDLS